MRLREFVNTNAAMMGILTHLRSRGKGKDTIRVKTDSFLKMLSNIGIKTDVAGLERIKATDDKLGRYFGNLDNEFVEINVKPDTTGGMDDFAMDMGPGEEDFGDFEDPAGMNGMDDFEEPDPGMEMDPMANEPLAAPGNVADPGGETRRVSNMAKRAMARRS